MQKIGGKVKTLTFRDAGSGYSVLKIVPKKKKGHANFITIVGILPGLEVGDEAEFNGAWNHHTKFGRQFAAVSYRLILPTSLEGLSAYLTAHISGIGPVYAKKIIDKFGEQTVKILANAPQKLAKIPGISLNKAKKISAAWKKDAATRKQMIKLAALGISPKLSRKIIQQYGTAAYSTIKRNPYRLAADLWGVGFIKADKIAHKLGFTTNHPERISAAVIHTLQKALEEGHLYLPQEAMLKKTQALINSPPEKIIAIIKRLIAQKTLVRDKQNAIYLAFYRHLEQKVAELIKQRQTRQKKQQPLMVNFDKAFAWVEKKQGFTLNRKQKAAVKTALITPISILTGGPGTGKSTTLAALVQILLAQDKTIALAAPTGRAAKRMSEVTGLTAKTIHRTLKIDKTGNALYNQHHPLPVDFIVVDEASMLDIILAYRIISSLAPHTHLLLVGDDNQLPSVQAGNVLADLIASGTVAVVQLTEIFRQARQSAIVRNAHKINAGYFPEFPRHPTDFYFFKQEDAAAAADLIVDLVSRRIPHKFGFDPLQDIQILAPLHKTACGVKLLNAKLQEKLNPESKKSTAITFGGQKFCLNDKVMQTINNYEKEVFNGEIGIVSAVNMENAGNKQFLVKYDDRIVSYKPDELNQLTLAYAVSVHKSQGSEYPAIVMPILTSHYIMLARNLLYTAITRAQKLVVLVGSKKAIGIAVNNNRAARRYTLLAERLQQLCYNSLQNAQS